MDRFEIESSWRDRLDALAGKRREVTIVIAVAVIAIVIASVGMGRAAPARIAPPSTEPETIGPSTVGGVVIHVSGAVRHPGLYTLAEGSRVADALTAAGGSRRTADLDRINLAAFLIDGTQVDVPRRGRPTTAPTNPSPTPGLVNVNTADAVLLETVPGIGPVTAAAIIEFRDQSGPFEAIDGLIEVPGIGPSTLESLRLYLTV